MRISDGMLKKREIYGREEKASEKDIERQAEREEGKIHRERGEKEIMIKRAEREGQGR